ncbi:MAG TPA: galactokinase [Opitutaceae bacterium]|nr:galactokinase [Opitutaceae bacterium]HND60999.1 galactokinase [Opitutaceae bacterium]
MKLLTENFRARFGRPPTLAARAPGRIEFIGNHTDYNGGTVLGASIDRGVTVALAPRGDGQWCFATENRAGVVTVSATEQPERRKGNDSWVNYPLGVIAALAAHGRPVPAGFDLLVTSDLPPGAGLSSSAALELSSGLAFLALTKQDVPRADIVQWCRHAENHFVGVPCGVLDQGVSGFGRKDHLVFIDCRGPTFSTVPLPSSARFWVFNTHTKHALVDGFYAARHRECMAAAQALGVALLADVQPAQVEASRSRLTPESYRRAKHVVEEIARVDATVGALRAGDLTAVGRLLTASHRSSQQWFENSTPELDFLVDQLVAQPGVHGARLSGGGFGGAVMALTTPEFGETQSAAVVTAYAAKFGSKPEVLRTQTGDGAAMLAL